MIDEKYLDEVTEETLNELSNNYDEEEDTDEVQ